LKAPVPEEVNFHINPGNNQIFKSDDKDREDYQRGEKNTGNAG
jgi:hypothetical protein